MNFKKLFLIPLILCTLTLSSQHRFKKPKNIIFLIGDGMGLSQISYPIMETGLQLNIARFKDIGLMNTSASNNKITDSGAGATAFSIGQKTQNGSIGVDSNNKSAETILELASKNKISTGLIATSSITHATPASFIAHNKNRAKTEDIAKDFLNTPIDIFVGGGLKDFENRKDSLNLCDSLLANGYTVFKNENDFFNTELTGKTAALLYSNHPPSMASGRGNFEERALDKSIQFLKNNKKGFFIMIEGSQIDWGGHDNNAKYIMEEMLDFDTVIKLALDFAEKDGETLVVVTADHETGGFALGAHPENEQNANNYGEISPSFTTTGHTASLVPVFAYGPGSHLFKGFLDNTDIYKKFKFLLKI